MGAIDVQSVSVNEGCEGVGGDETLMDDPLLGCATF